MYVFSIFYEIFTQQKLINIRRSGVSFFSDYVENPAKTMYTETELEQLSPNICLIYVQSEILNYISVKQAFQMIFRIMCFLLLRNLRMEIKFKIELNPFLTQVFKKFSLKRLHGLSLTVRSMDCTPLDPWSYGVCRSRDSRQDRLETQTMEVGNLEGRLHVHLQTV